MTLFFSDRELCDKETGIVQLAPGRGLYPGFAERIDAIRRAWNEPLIVNSCCRSAAHNAAIGGHPRSLHVYDKPFHDTGGTCAIDFRLFDTEERNQKFKALATMMHFSVGDEPTCIHIDDRTLLLGLPQKRFEYDASKHK